MVAIVRLRKIQYYWPFTEPQSEWDPPPVYRNLTIYHDWWSSSSRVVKSSFATQQLTGKAEAFNN